MEYFLFVYGDHVLWKWRKTNKIFSWNEQRKLLVWHMSVVSCRDTRIWRRNNAFAFTGLTQNGIIEIYTDLSSTNSIQSFSVAILNVKNLAKVVD